MLDKTYGFLGRELQRLEQGRHLGKDDLESGQRVAFLQFLVTPGLLIQVGLAVTPVVPPLFPGHGAVFLVASR